MTIDLNAFLDSSLESNNKEEFTSFDVPLAKDQELIRVINLEEGEIDPRLKQLSHSSITTLHTCPRKYQLYRLNSTKVTMADQKEMEQGVTFAYGKAVGVGVQSCMAGKSESQIIMDMFLEWDVDLLDENPKQKKSFWLAIFAVRKFIQLKADGFLNTHSLVYIDGEPAIELSFMITLPDGFKYRGFVDAVLQDDQTGEVLVLENKTSSGSANAANFVNSGQALGYSVVLDILFPKMSSYTVLYLVYETKTMEYVELPFQKSLLKRALWLAELQIDVRSIRMYEEYGTYPKYGNNCFSFFRDCEYLGICGLSTENMTKPLTSKLVKEIEDSPANYQYVISFDDLVQTQIDKGEL